VADFPPWGFLSPDPLIAPAPLIPPPKKRLLRSFSLKKFTPKNSSKAAYNEHPKIYNNPLGLAIFEDTTELPPPPLRFPPSIHRHLYLVQREICQLENILNHREEYQDFLNNNRPRPLRGDIRNYCECKSCTDVVIKQRLRALYKLSEESSVGCADALSMALRRAITQTRLLLPAKKTLRFKRSISSISQSWPVCLYWKTTAEHRDYTYVVSN